MSRSSSRRSAALALAVTATTATYLVTASSASAASGPPQSATAFASGVVGPDGGAVSGFGITATFDPGAVTSDRLIILGNWPNGLDVPPPNGEKAVKTFGLQECNPDGTACTSVFGNFGNSPSGTERVQGRTIPYTGFQSLPANGNTTFGTAQAKKVTFTISTGADKVYIYNANNDGLAAYPGPGTAPAGTPLPSTSGNGTLTFSTFQPIVWVLTVPGPGN